MSTVTQTIQIRRGNFAQLPSLLVGEPAFTLDTKTLYIGDGSSNIPISGGNAPYLSHSNTLSSDDSIASDKNGLASSPLTVSASLTLYSSLVFV